MECDKARRFRALNAGAIFLVTDATFLDMGE